MTNYHKTWMNIGEFPNIFSLYIFNLKNKNVSLDSLQNYITQHATFFGFYDFIRRYN